MKRRGFLASLVGIPAVVAAAHIPQAEAKAVKPECDDSFAAYLKWRGETNTAPYMNLRTPK